MTTSTRQRQRAWSDEVHRFAHWTLHDLPEIVKTERRVSFVSRCGRGSEEGLVRAAENLSTLLCEMIDAGEVDDPFRVERHTVHSAIPTLMLSDWRLDSPVELDEVLAMILWMPSQFVVYNDDTPISEIAHALSVDRRELFFSFGILSNETKSAIDYYRRNVNPRHTSGLVPELMESAWWTAPQFGEMLQNLRASMTVPYANDALLWTWLIVKLIYNAYPNSPTARIRITDLIAQRDRKTLDVFAVHVEMLRRHPFHSILPFIDVGFANAEHIAGAIENGIDPALAAEMFLGSNGSV